MVKTSMHVLMAFYVTFGGHHGLIIGLIYFSMALVDLPKLIRCTRWSRRRRWLKRQALAKTRHALALKFANEPPMTSIVVGSDSTTLSATDGQCQPSMQLAEIFGSPHGYSFDSFSVTTLEVMAQIQR